MSGSAFFWGLDGIEFLNDTTGPYLTAHNPATGSTEINLSQSIYFEIIDALSDVDETETIVYLNLGEEVEVYDYTNSFQNDYSGSVTEQTIDGRKYYEVTITSPSGGWPGDTLITVRVIAKDNKGNSSDISYSFTTTSAEHIIKYNIYYSTVHQGTWTLSNPEPLNHNINGNEWSIDNLTAGVTYHIAIVAGTEIDGEWVPLAPQSLVKTDRGAGDLAVIDSYPYYIVRTVLA